jgi:hypothetical protein
MKKRSTEGPSKKGSGEGPSKKRSAAKAVRKAYEPPHLIVYGKVSDLTQGGRRGHGRGHGGSRS